LIRREGEILSPLPRERKQTTKRKPHLTEEKKNGPIGEILRKKLLRRFAQRESEKRGRLKRRGRTKKRR